MKDHTFIPVPEDKKAVFDYRSIIENRIKEVPDVPMFSFTDNESGERREVLPDAYLNTIDNLGRWFSSMGCKRSHIAILGDNSYEWILTMFAVAMSDNVLVTLDKGLEMQTLEYIVEKSKSSLLFYSAAFEEKAKELGGKFDLKLYKLEDIEKYAKEGESLPETGVIKTDADAPAILMYTSGTTGLPKGVLLSQRNIVGNIHFAAMNTDFSGNSVYLLPLNHIYGLGSALLITIITNHTVTVNTNMRYMMNDIQTTKPEILFIVPLFVQTLYGAFRRFLKAKGLTEKIDAMIAENNRKGDVTAEQKREMFAEVLAFFGGRLTRIVSGGAPLDMDSYRGFYDLGISVLNGYGITECAPVLAVNPIDDNIPESVGRVIPSLEVKIQDPDENGYGEICAKGPTVMLGYFENEEENKKSLIDGWFHTGDKGWLDDRDHLYVCGRIKNLIILANGENVSPEELEGMIYQRIKAVGEVVVYDKDSRITAQVFINEDYVRENGIEDPQKVVKDGIYDLNLELAVYKRINDVEFRDTPFEKTTSKKIKRNI